MNIMQFIHHETLFIIYIVDNLESCGGIEGT